MYAAEFRRTVKIKFPRSIRFHQNPLWKIYSRALLPPFFSIHLLLLGRLHTYSFKKESIFVSKRAERKGRVERAAQLLKTRLVRFETIIFFLLRPRPKGEEFFLLIENFSFQTTFLPASRWEKRVGGPPPLVRYFITRFRPPRVGKEFLEVLAPNAKPLKLITSLFDEKSGRECAAAFRDPRVEENVFGGGKLSSEARGRGDPKRLVGTLSKMMGGSSKETGCA